MSLVVLLLLGVPALQSARSWGVTTSTQNADATAPTNTAAPGAEVVTAEATTAGAIGAAHPGVAEFPSTAGTSPAQPAQVPPVGSAAARGTQPPSRSLRSNTKAKAPPPKPPVRDVVAVAVPAPVVVPERSVDVPAQAVPSMSSVAAVPVAPLGQTYDAAQVDVRPRVETQVSAVVPEHLRQRNVDGVVVLRVRVSAAGHPADVQVLRKSSVDAALDAAAVAAVRKWRFSPARRRGETVNCWLNVGVPFHNEAHDGTR